MWIYTSTPLYAFLVWTTKYLSANFLYGAAIGQSIQGLSCSLDDSGMYLLSLRGKRTFTPFADCTKQLPIKRLPQALFPDLKRLASAAIGTLSYLINFSSYFFSSSWKSGAWYVGNREWRQYSLYTTNMHLFVLFDCIVAIYIICVKVRILSTMRVDLYCQDYADKSLILV